METTPEPPPELADEWRGPRRLRRIAGFDLALGALREVPSALATSPWSEGGAGELHDPQGHLHVRLHLPRPGTAVSDQVDLSSADQTELIPALTRTAAPLAGIQNWLDHSPPAVCLPTTEGGEDEGGGRHLRAAAILALAPGAAPTELHLDMQAADGMLSLPQLKARLEQLTASLRPARLRYSPGGISLLFGQVGLGLMLLAGALWTAGWRSALPLGMLALAAGAVLGLVPVWAWRWREALVLSQRAGPHPEAVGHASLRGVEVLRLLGRQTLAGLLLTAQAVGMGITRARVALPVAAALHLSLTHGAVWWLLGAFAALHGWPRLAAWTLAGWRAGFLAKGDLWGFPGLDGRLATPLSRHVLPVLQRLRADAWRRQELLPRLTLGLLLVGAALGGLDWLPLRAADLWVLLLGGGLGLVLVRRHLLLPADLREAHREWRLDATDDLAAETLARGFLAATGSRAGARSAGRALAWAVESVRLQPSAGMPCLLVARAALTLAERLAEGEAFLDKATPRLCHWVVEDALRAAGERYLDEPARAELAVLQTRLADDVPG